MIISDSINSEYSKFTIGRIASGTNELAGSRLIIYFGCSTGNDCYASNGSPHNLVDETFEKGAHCVIGLSKNVGQDSAFRWMEEFLFGVLGGESIRGAVAYANNRCQQYGGIFIEGQTENDSTMPLYIVGDKYQYLN